MKDLHVLFMIRADFDVSVPCLGLLHTTVISLPRGGEKKERNNLHRPSIGNVLKYFQYKMKLQQLHCSSVAKDNVDAWKGQSTGTCLNHRRE